MNELKIFENEEFGEIRTVVIDGEPWFVGKDVAAALGYVNTKDALSKHIDDEDKIIGSQNTTPYILDSMGRKQYPVYINESGLYALILSSKLPSAKKFKRWVTSEVLPSLRKSGTYSMTGTSETVSLQDIVDVLTDTLTSRFDERYEIKSTKSHLHEETDGDTFFQKKSDKEWCKEIAKKITDYAVKSRLDNGSLIYKDVYNKFLSQGINLNNRKYENGYYDQPTIMFVASVPAYRTLFEKYLDDLIQTNIPFHVKTWDEAQQVIANSLKLQNFFTEALNIKLTGGNFA